ncbi:MAG: hypothetical protein AB1420_15910 [Bacillota bacterium]
MDKEFQYITAYELAEREKKMAKPQEKKEAGKERAEKSERTEIAVIQPTEFEIMDRRDEEQILKELQGAYLDEFVYSFRLGNRDIVGLSWAGVKEIARKMGNISIKEIKVDETEKSYRVLAKAEDEVRRITMFGVAEQSKKMRLGDGREIDDVFALNKALSKAQRNAIRSVIPELMIKTMMQQFLEQQKK